MKLWLKISLISLILVAAATGICSLLMLRSTASSSLGLAVEHALTDQRLRATNWYNAMHDALREGSDYSETAQRTLSRYMIGQFTDANTSLLLLSDADQIYNTTAINPLEYLRVEETEYAYSMTRTQQYIITDIGGRTMLLVGSHMLVRDTPYTMYILQDITDVYASVNALATRFTLINLVVIALAGAGIILLVRLVLRPVAALKAGASQIADGIYDRRIPIHERDEIGELAGDFNRMAAAVEAHVQALEEEAARRTLFMSALTHELKTPMTSISGNAQTLLRTRMTEEEREDALLHMDEECTRIERLSQKLMQLIVLRQQGELRLEQQPVAALLHIVQHAAAEQVKQRGLTLTVENSMDTLPMEQDLLTSLLLNLIDNAGKASQPGGTIRLVAAGDTIAVADTGKGIPPEELHRITQPFYMVDKSRARAAGGIGLGLALAEEIARLHGARLEFISEPGAGTTVKVVFAHV